MFIANRDCVAYSNSQTSAQVVKQGACDYDETVVLLVGRNEEDGHDM